MTRQTTESPDATEASDPPIITEILVEGAIEETLEAGKTAEEADDAALADEDENDEAESTSECAAENE